MDDRQTGIMRWINNLTVTFDMSNLKTGILCVSESRAEVI